MNYPNTYDLKNVASIETLQSNLLELTKARYNMNHKALIEKGFQKYLEQVIFCLRAYKALKKDRFHHSNTRASKMKKQYLLAVLNKFKQESDIEEKKIQELGLKIFTFKDIPKQELGKAS